jgi:hypothetical protein
MSKSYTVVRVQDLVALPALLQWPEAKEQNFAANLQDALNQQASEGWEFVCTYGGVGSIYLIFRRERPQMD